MPPVKASDIKSENKTIEGDENKLNQKNVTNNFKTLNRNALNENFGLNQKIKRLVLLILFLFKPENHAFSPYDIELNDITDKAVKINKNNSFRVDGSKVFMLLSFNCIISVFNSELNINGAVEKIMANVIVTIGIVNALT